jgi:hypothetical protein
MRFTLLWVIPVCLLAESVAGLHWTAPAGWKNEGSRPMRAATYVVPPAPGEPEGSECVVYFFGPGQGGSVEANIDRWKGQFKESGSKPAAPHVQKRNIHGLQVTTIDVSGEYTGMGGPMATQSHAVAGYRMLGAVVEGPQGNVFIKFAAPAKTVAANQQKFEQLLDSFQK